MTRHAPADRRRLASLLRRENGVQLLPGAPDDRVELRLHPAPDGPQLPPLAIHDRVDSNLLLGREAQLSGEAVPELPVSMGVHAP